jgi:hypothetical protein
VRASRPATSRPRSDPRNARSTSSRSSIPTPPSCPCPAGQGRDRRTSATPTGGLGGKGRDNPQLSHRDAQVRSYLRARCAASAWDIRACLEPGMRNIRPCRDPIVDRLGPGFVGGLWGCCRVVWWPLRWGGAAWRSGSGPSCRRGRCVI